MLEDRRRFDGWSVPSPRSATPYDCCAIVAESYSFNLGVRKENRFIFSFRLNGLGTIGIELPGTGFR